MAARHKWVRLREHFYICRKCGCGKQNIEPGAGGDKFDWATKWHMPTGVSKIRRHTPPCELGPRSEAYLAKYAVEIQQAAEVPF